MIRSHRSDNEVADPIVEDAKVTTKKAKDPKRVEMGKKLAELSKAARERKAKQKRDAEADAEAAADSVVSVPTEAVAINYGYLIGTVALLATIGSLYYARMTYNRKAPSGTRSEPLPPESANEPSVPQRPPKEKAKAKVGRFIKI